PEGAWKAQFLRRSRLGPRVAELNRVMDGMLDRRDPAAASEDLVGLLLAARDEETGEAFARHEIRDQIMTFLLAGHETTSAALTPPYLHPRDETPGTDPTRFDPTRFLPEYAQARPRLSYMPFGYGPRVCMGGRFALMEAILITAMVAQRFTLDLEPDREIGTE